MTRPMTLLRRLVLSGGIALLGGCAFAPGIDLPTENAGLVQGPPVTDIVTPFDQALTCLKGRVHKEITFAVGAILDSTGKEQFTEGGAGKFVTQGAGEIVQSALFRAGVTVLNRRDPRIITTEAEWGIRAIRTQVPVDYFVTGSINSLDFIPGGGASVTIAGVGPRYRQSRILIGLDLSITQSSTGLIVANVPLQKQIFASEVGFGVGRFFGETLVLMEIGGQEREAVSYALRQMLSYATFDLLTQLMSPQNYLDCRAMIDSAFAEQSHYQAVAEPAAMQHDSSGGNGSAAPPASQGSAGGLAPTNGGSYGETEDSDLPRRIIQDDYSSGSGGDRVWEEHSP